MFYKLENGNLQRLRLPLRIKGKDVFTNDPELLAENGYYPLEIDDYPDDDEKHYELKYEIVDNVIHGTWEEVEDNV